MMSSACLYQARVMHRRARPAPYRFVYRVFSLLVDIDQLDELHKQSSLLSVNRFNLVSFYESDHLPEGETSLRGWIDGVLRSHQIDPARLTVKLLCFPRILGWVFNPLSIWYCMDRQGVPRAIVCEVRNTFGERHCYLLRPGVDAAWPVREQCQKQFHVSPFIEMDAQYHFCLDEPGERLRVLIKEYQDEQLLLVASQTGVAQALTTASLLRQLLRVPLQTVRVLVGIHWQALKIWLRGTPFNSKPAPPVKEVS